MFDGASNVQLAGELSRMHYPKFSVMRWFEHTVSLFLNDVGATISRIPILNILVSVKIFQYPYYNLLIARYTYQMVKKRMEVLYVLDLSRI